MSDEFNNEEKEILDSLEKGEWQSLHDHSKAKADPGNEAANSSKKNKSLSIEISEEDFTQLQKTAFIEGLPVQTYVSGIIHKFVNRKIVD
jgi:predicted DNA binding CopG/RHH family protein